MSDDQTQTQTQTPPPDAGDELATLRAELAAERQRTTVITGRYRDLVVKANPDVGPLAHLVAGDDPDAIDASAATALKAVQAIRSTATPPPAPPGAGVVQAPATTRQPLDTGSMSPGELIRAGLTQRGR